SQRRRGVSPKRYAGHLLRCVARWMSDVFSRTAALGFAALGMFLGRLLRLASFRRFLDTDVLLGLARSNHLPLARHTAAVCRLEGTNGVVGHGRRASFAFEEG